MKSTVSLQISCFTSGCNSNRVLTHKASTLDTKDMISDLRGCKKNLPTINWQEVQTRLNVRLKDCGSEDTFLKSTVSPQISCFTSGRNATVVKF